MYINNKSKLQDSHTKGNTITEIHINVLPTVVLDFQYTKTLTQVLATGGQMLGCDNTVNDIINET